MLVRTLIRIPQATIRRNRIGRIQRDVFKQIVCLSERSGGNRSFSALKDDRVDPAATTPDTTPDTAPAHTDVTNFTAVAVPSTSSETGAEKAGETKDSTAVAATSTSATGAPPPSTSEPGSDKAGDKKEEDQPKKKSYFSYYASFFAAVAIYYGYRYYRQDQIIKICVKEGIALTEDELDDIIAACALNSLDLKMIKECLEFLAPSGFLRPDNFGAYMHNTIQRVKQEKKLQRQHAEAQREGVQAAYVTTTNPDGSVSTVQPQPEMVDLEYYDDDEDQAKDWHFVAFFRLSELDEYKRADLDEILTAIATLAEDMKPRSQWEFVVEAKRDRLRRLNRNRWTKLERAWEFADVDGDRILSHSELSALFGRMMRVGFWSASELVYQSIYIPPQFEIFKPEMIADKYFQELGKHADKDGLSWKEFRNVTESCRIADVSGQPLFWFLADKRIGFFKGRQIKWTERYNRWRHRNGYEQHPLLAVDPATIGYSPRTYQARGATAVKGGTAAKGAATSRKTQSTNDDDDEYEDYEDE